MLLNNHSRQFKGTILPTANMQVFQMYCNCLIRGSPRAVINVHETVLLWLHDLLCKKAEEMTLGLHVHQELRLYCGDLSFNSLLLEARGWRVLRDIKKYLNLLPEGSCARDGFH